MALGLTPQQIIDKGTHPLLEISKGWERIELKNIATVQNGFAFSSKLFNHSEGLPLIRIRDIFSKETENLYSGGYKDEFIVNNGDILIGMDGDFKVSKWPGKKGLLNQRVCRIHFQSEYYNKEFLYLCIQPYLDAIHSETSAVTVKHLSSRTINNIPFPLPPLVEQQAIVNKIEALFSSLDSGIADLKKAQDQLKIYRQAVLKKAFEGELTKEWRENNNLEPSFDFLKGIVKQRKASKPDKKSIYHKKISYDFNFSKDDKIETWSKGTLDKLIYIAARIGWRGLKKNEYTETGPLFLSVHSLNYGKYVDYSQAYHISEERYIESPEIKLQEGDVLLCKDGSGIGKIGIIKDLKTKASVNSSLLVIRGMNILTQEFLYYLFSGPKLQSIVLQRITGSATPHLFQNDIKKFELQIPPIQEQHQIVQEI